MAGKADHLKNMQTDLAQGKEWEAIVGRTLGGVPTPETFPHRHLGDMTVPWLNGLYVEAKRDSWVDTSKRVCLEFADFSKRQSFAQVSGVFKHRALDLLLNHQSIVVHSLGDAMNWCYVYSTVEVMDLLTRVTEARRSLGRYGARGWYMQTWNSDWGVTGGMLVPTSQRTDYDHPDGVRRKFPHPAKAFRLCHIDQLRDTVAQVADQAHTMAATMNTGDPLTVYRNMVDVFMPNSDDSNNPNNEYYAYKGAVNIQKVAQTRHHFMGTLTDLRPKGHAELARLHQVSDSSSLGTMAA